jgi:uncharacterized protein
MLEEDPHEGQRPKEHSMIENSQVTNLTITVASKGETSGVCHMPRKPPKDVGVIVAHGAGNDMETPLVVSFADGLARAGYATMRFNFLYAQQKKRSPDRPATLVQTWRAAYERFREVTGLQVSRVVAAGKSMGGRIASQMVADGLLPVSGLIFLGYPLHPADDKERLRDAHLYSIQVPMLFFAGTRDPLCDPAKLATVLPRLKAPYTLHTVEGGDHSFHRLKSQGITDEKTHAEILKRSVEWLGRLPD